MSEDKRTIIHICNEGTPQHNCVADQVPSEEKFNKYRWPADAVYLININLNWGDRKLSSDYGFEIAHKLRTEHKSLAPIVFYSYIQDDDTDEEPNRTKYFEFKADSSNKLEYKLLYGRGSAFLRAPFDEIELNEAITTTPLLTEASRTDLITSLGTLKGLLLQAIHDLKIGSDIDAILGRIEPSLDPIHKRLIQFSEFYDELIQAKLRNDKQKFDEVRQNFAAKCAELSGNEQLRNLQTDEVNYKILLVEDDEDDLKRATKYLEESFEVTPVREAQKAIEIIKGDVANEFAAVICDWRLYRSGTPYWQKYQGYEVLEIAGKSGNRALFALTSQEDHLVHSIRNEMDLKFHLVKKQSVQTPSQKKLFVEVIHEHCQRALADSFVSQSTEWNRDYKQLFVTLRSSTEWPNFLLKVNAIADFVFSRVTAAGPSSRIDLKKDFKLPVKTKGSFNLDNILVLRLIWFARWLRDTYEEGMDYEEVTSGLQRIYSRTTAGKIAKSYTNELNKLGFVRDDFLVNPQTGLPNILPHERQWLEAKGFLPRFSDGANEVLIENVEDRFSPEEEAERQELQSLMLGCSGFNEVMAKMGQERWSRYQKLVNKKSKFDEQRKRADEQQKRNAKLETLKKSLHASKRR